MCHFITATLPQSVKLDSVAPIFESHKLGFDLVSNPHVSAQIESEDWHILTTRGHCDCDTVLGSLSRSVASEPISYERDLKKFREKNWSEAKIQRWLEQKEQTKEKHLREDEDQARRTTPDAAHWIGFITDVLISGHTRRIGLLLHMYHGGVESERIQILGRQKVNLKELTTKLLMEMKEDVVYEFVV